MPLPGTPWGKSKPTIISEEIRKKIQNMCDTGKIIGHWNKQELLTKKVGLKESHKGVKEKGISKFLSVEKIFSK